MPDATIKAKTGNAPLVKQGHTATNNYGSNPNAQRKGTDSPRDLSIK